MATEVLLPSLKRAHTAPRSPKRILYVAADDSRQRSSGNNGYYLRRGLEGHFGEMDLMGPVPRAPYLASFWAAWKVVSRRIDQLERPVFCSPGMARDHGARVADRARELGAELIFGNGPPAVAGLERYDIPYAFMTDATVSGLLDLGGYTDDWAERSIQRWLATDRAAVLGAQAVFYASTWAAECAIRDYGADPSRIHVVRSGANIDEPPGDALLCSVPPRQPWTLLFYGRDWGRKGGPFAVATTRALRDRGLDARLIVCGPKVGSIDFTDDDFVELVPPINKDLPGGLERFADLCARSHFLILPTQSDCTPGAIREAAAFGLPAVASDVGGIASLIDDGVTGFALPLSDNPSGFASKIAAALSDVAVYRGLRRGARDMFESTLNWDTAASSIAQVMDGRL